MARPINRDKLQRLLREEQAQLVEVLSADQHEDEHLPGARYPTTEARLQDGPAARPARPVIVYCYDYQ